MKESSDNSCKFPEKEGKLRVSHCCLGIQSRRHLIIAGTQFVIILIILSGFFQLILFHLFY